MDRLGFETALPLGNKEYRTNRSLEQGRQPVSLGHLNLRAQKDVYGEVSDKQPDTQAWGLRDSGGPTVSLLLVTNPESYQSHPDRVQKENGAEESGGLARGKGSSRGG